MEQIPFDLHQLAAMIDYAHLKVYGINRSLEEHCAEAIACGFAMVAIHPCDIERCVQLLHGSKVHIGAVIGFPIGANTQATKENETRDAIERGAHEIDMMINLRALLADQPNLVFDEITSVVEICKANKTISKIILETCYLNREQKITVCNMAIKAGADFVKTSTGFGPKGATREDVRLMREIVGDNLGVKAAGGIRNLQDTLSLISAGANRIGTSHGVDIYNEFKNLLAK